MRQGKYINTFSGGQFWPLSPEKDEIKVIDIAHGLSMLCRANGHYKHFYSVAQHSIHCAEEAKLRGLSHRIQLACLLHDASEAYIGDLTRPLKSLIDKFLEIEAQLQQKIYEAFGLNHLSDDEVYWVQEIDDAMLNYEMSLLLNNNGLNDKVLLKNYDLSFKLMAEVKQTYKDSLNQLICKVE